MEISIKAAENGQRFRFAFMMRVVRTKAASRVLLPLLKPNCSGPRRPLVSAAVVILSHILTVMRRRRFEGMVMGLYWPGWRESPP